MATVGEILREVRESKGISLADAERETKIRQKYLAALEEDDLSAMPGPLYVRGFLRKYATFLELEADEINQVYDTQTTPTRTRIRAARGEPPVKPKGKDPNAININPLSPEKIDTRVRYGVSYVALSLLAIPLIIVFYFIYSAYSGNTDKGQLGIATPGVATVTALPTEVIGLAVTPNVPTAVAISPTLAVTGTQPPVIGGIVTAIPTNVVVDATATISRTEGVALEIRTINDAWVRVTVDGAIRYEGTLAKGTTRTWNGKEAIGVRSGRSSSVNITVNGDDKGRLRDPDSPDQQGEDNEIVEKEWNKSGDERVIQK